MKIFSVIDPEFKPYGRVVTGLDTAKAEILAALANTPLPAATDYVAEDAALQELPAAVEVSEHLFGGMPCQLGWCNGHNTYLNCLEYHRDSEFNLGTEDFVLLLARQEEIAGGKLDTAKVKAFRVPAGTLVEVYATTLHYAPCHVDAAKGFRVLVALPKGTNTAKPAIKNDGGDDPQLWACNKWLLAHPDSSGVIYCATRKNVEEVCDRLLADGFRATRYHAGLSDEERRANQEAFTYDDAPIMVATNAFGMGIDKSNVRFVLHYNMPKNMESYYQEAGRAGRDGAKADCILFYSGQDVITNQFFIEQDRDNEELTGEALEEVRRQDRERLKKMTFYCHTTDCLRDYMLRYFGEFGSNYCGNCSNCLNTFETIDITELANDLIGCILTSGMRFGVNVILDTLRGSKNEKVLRFGLDSNRYYATHAQDTIVFLRQVLNYLVLTDYLVVTDDQFPIVKVKEKGLSFYAESGEFRPVLTMKAARKTTQTPAKAGQLPGTDKSGRKRSSLHTGSDPFEALRRLRTEIARAQHIPPYLVFSDKSLESMCVLLPQTKTEMLAVHGVGELKYQKYGEQFLALCQKLAGESEEF